MISTGVTYSAKIYFYSHSQQPKIHIVAETDAGEVQNIAQELQLSKKSEKFFQYRKNLKEGEKSSFYFSEGENQCYSAAGDHNQQESYSNQLPPQIDEQNKQKPCNHGRRLFSITGGKENQTYVVYRQNLVVAKKNKIPNTNKLIIISTDLGGTLMGDMNALEQFNLNWIKNFYFDVNAFLIYNTGRCIISYKKSEKNSDLLSPNFLVSRCGSQIFTQIKGKLELDELWRARVLDHWNYQPILENINQFTWIQRKVREEDLKEVVSLRYFTKDEKLFIEQQKEFFETVQRLRDQGIKFQTVIRQQIQNTHFEFLPENTNQGTALERICSFYLKTNSKFATVFGDSNNDIEMMEQAGRGVIVSNATEEVKNLVTLNKQRFPNVEISLHNNANALNNYLISIKN